MRPREPVGARVGRALATFVAPALAALVVLRVAMPSRLEGVRGGLVGLLARLGDEQSLLVFVALFLALAEVGRYWHRRAGAAAPASASVGPRGPRRTVRFVAVVAVMALGAFFVRRSVAAVVRVVGPSMLPTLEIGDRVLVDRVAYGPRAAPRRGDLVVFSATIPGVTDGPQRMVKRVLGTAGDVIDAQNGSLRINGWQIPFCDAGPYAVMTGRLTVRGRLTVEFLGDAAYLTVHKPIEQAFAPYTVKPGEVFVVGDDRGLSSDSRLWSDSSGNGVPVSALEGRVSRVLAGALPDGRLDLSRLLARPLTLEVRQPNLDLSETRKRIEACLKARPRATLPP